MPDSPRRQDALDEVANEMTVGAGRLGTTGRRSIDRAARVGVLDDLRLRISGLLDDEVAVVPLDDLLRLEDLVAIEDREPPRILADVLVFPTGELDELVAPQSAAFADEGQQTGRVLADLHSLVHSPEGRLVYRDALPALTVHVGPE